jgi:hypothetical protein
MPSTKFDVMKVAIDVPFAHMYIYNPVYETSSPFSCFPQRSNDEDMRSCDLLGCISPHYLRKRFCNQRATGLCC